MKNLNQIETEILDKIKNIKDHDTYNSVKTEVFGKKGIITELFKKIGELKQEEKKEYASQLNLLKIKVTEILNKKISDFDQIEINKKLKNEKIDVTLPGRTFFFWKNSSSFSSY